MMDINLYDVSAVNKSYPGFWEDVEIAVN